MNNLLIIGNGFDLDLGLPTKYSNFIESKYFKNRTLGEEVNYLNISVKHIMIKNGLTLRMN